MEAVHRHYRESRAVSGFTGADTITNEELLALPVDILIPAALGGVIHRGNVEGIRAKIVVEAANHPVTPAADDALNRMGVIVLPDILVNAGGVIVSYFEWAQNIQEFRWEESRVNEELWRRMRQATDLVWDRAQKEKVIMREAAFMIGVERVARAAQLRGFV
jgi:glutamate dehydrogenase (NAD(P)+)